MEYRQFPAPPDLAPWVECLWILRGAMASEGQTILPDGRMELVFHFGAPPVQQPGALIAGQMTGALRLLPRGAMDTLGVRLRPEAGACLMPASMLAGLVQPMDAVLGIWARRAREEAGNGRDRVGVIVRHLRPLLDAAKELDAAVTSSIERIERNHGRGAMDAFVPNGLQTRQWQRRFVAATGLTPKAFARIARLQRLVALYQSGQWRRWADLALESGFYDQAHLANDFREFAGQSPDAFFREGRGMTEFLS
jgi:hypothetical protein